MNQVVNPSIDASLPSYCLRFGWSADPFNSHSDKAPYYIPSSWDQYLDVIQYVYQHENALISIVGTRGCGKSTLLKQSLLQIDSNTLTHVLYGNHKLTPESLLLSLSHAFNLPIPLGETLEEKYDNLLSSIQLNSQPCLLIFDNAHLLSIEVIQHIFYCIEQQTDYQMRLHFILVGDLALKQLLDTAGFNRPKQIKIHSLLLQKFNQSETTHYLQHRINTVNRLSQLPFAIETIKFIQTKSSGYPDQINKTASDVLQHGIKQNQILNLPLTKSSSFSFQPWLIGGLLTLVIICAVSFYLKSIGITTPTLNSDDHKSTLINTTLAPVTIVPSNTNLKKQTSGKNSLNPLSSINNKGYVKLNTTQINSINNMGLLNTTNPISKKIIIKKPMAPKIKAKPKHKLKPKPILVKKEITQPNNNVPASDDISLQNIY